MSCEEPLPYSRRSIGQFLADLGSPTPVPGGGSAAALAGALAAALVGMVAGLRLARPPFGDDMGARLSEIAERAEVLRARLLALVDDDATAYAQVRAAYKLPRSSAEERTVRAARIDAALRQALAPPMAMAAACAELLPLAAFAAEQGPRSASSDAYAAALLGQACLLIAEQNVQANLHGLHDNALRAHLQAQLAVMRTAAGEALLRAQAASRIEGRPGAPAP